jgi:hypothetical protein
LSDWYVFQHDGAHLGPWPTEGVAHQILAGRLSAEVWVAAPGGTQWLRALDVPAIAALIDGVPTRPKRRDSGLRLMPGAFAVTPSGRPAFGSKVMMVTDEDLDDAAVTAKMPAMQFDADGEPTARTFAPPTPTPVGAGPTLESAGNVRRRKARG